MRSILQLTVLALAFAVTMAVGIFAPTHEVSANPTVVSKGSFDETFENP